MILAIDQGTTGTTCLVFDGEGRIRGRAYSEFRQHFPRPGWVEHDANEIWEVTKRVASHALADAKADAGEPRRDRDHQPARDRGRLGPARRGEPVHNALVWQDRRTAARCDELREAGHEQLVRERTGLVLDPYFSGDEDRVAAAQRRRGARRGLRHDRLLAGVQAHRPPRHRPLQRLADDAVRHPRAALGSGAVRPARRRPATGCPSRCRRPGSSAPRPSSAARSRSRGSPATSRRRSSARRASGPGMAKNTYGTGSFVLLNAGDRGARAGGGPADDDRLGDRRRGHLRARGRRCSSPAPRCSGCATGSGSSPRRPRPRGWRPRSSPTTTSTSSPRSPGLGSPHWDPYARGTIVGLTRGTTRAHLARAALEAIAYQTVDAVRAQERRRRRAARASCAPTAARSPTGG